MYQNQSHMWGPVVILAALLLYRKRTASTIINLDICHGFFHKIYVQSER